MSIFSKLFRKGKKYLKRKKFNSIYRRARGLRDEIVSAYESDIIQSLDPKVLLLLDVILEDYKWKP